MLQKRLIPVLLIQDKRLVKSIVFSKHNYLGDPINAVKIFSTKTVDELIITDISATRKNLVDLDYLKKIANECFIPLTYCGGINSIKIMKEIYKIGFEKIGLDSVLFNDKSFLSHAVNEFGSSSVVASITIRKNLFGTYKPYDFIKKKFRKDNLLESILNIQDQNPGEIFINNASNDGLMNGYDIKLIENIAPNISVPFSVCGGAGDIKDATDILKINEVTGAAAGSIFVYSSKERGIMINYPDHNSI